MRSNLQVFLLFCLIAISLAANAATRCCVDIPPGGPAPDIAPYQPDPAHPYAHPFYWAPFVLIGNWK